jgi:hypothetical protein
MRWLTAVGSLHLPHRPAWTCQRCGLPYPCPTARDRLLAVYGRTPALARRASDLLYEAVPDLAGVPPADLFDRFIAWTDQTGRRPGNPQSSR